jgi:hypothetical protein
MMVVQNVAPDKFVVLAVAVKNAVQAVRDAQQTEERQPAFLMLAAPKQWEAYKLFIVGGLLKT